MKYVAVGFKVTETVFIFSFKSSNVDYFWRRLKEFIEETKPDFVSLRFVKEE
ncbi:hypothetical protein ES703_02143 [subsurface metagenome]